MPNLTTNFSFNKPLVNDAIDEDLWGGQLNDNWDSIDTLLDQFTPIGSIQAYSGTVSPNAKWLLCDNSAVSRTTYATLFALVATAYGIGDGSTTFNLPDYRGRSIVGLDNMGGSSANRITDANADSLNNTGFGSETPSGTLSGSTDGTAITEAQLPSSVTIDQTSVGNVDNVVTGNQKIAVSASGSRSMSYTVALGSGSPHTHPLTGVTVTGSAGDNLPPGIVSAVIIRAL